MVVSEDKSSSSLEENMDDLISAIERSNPEANPVKEPQEIVCNIGS